MIKTYEEGMNYGLDIAIQALETDIIIMKHGKSKEVGVKVLEDTLRSLKGWKMKNGVEDYLTLEEMK